MARFACLVDAKTWKNATFVCISIKPTAQSGLGLVGIKDSKPHTTSLRLLSLLQAARIMDLSAWSKVFDLPQSRRKRLQLFWWVSGSQAASEINLEGDQVVVVAEGVEETESTETCRPVSG
jgi:hypothetical protein